MKKISITLSAKDVPTKTVFYSYNVCSEEYRQKSPIVLEFNNAESILGKCVAARIQMSVEDVKILITQLQKVIEKK